MNIYDKIESSGLKLKEIEHDIAYRVGDTVYYNKHLKSNPEWLTEVLNHELRHSGAMSVEDFKMDFFEGNFFRTLKFCLKHPKACTTFLPITFHDGKIALDWNLIIMYFLILMLIIFILSL